MKHWERLSAGLGGLVIFYGVPRALEQYSFVIFCTGFVAISYLLGFLVVGSNEERGS